MSLVWLFADNLNGSGSVSHGCNLFFSYSSFLDIIVPKLITPEHDYSKRPLQLFWLDGLALQAIAESDEETMYLLQVQDSEIDASTYPLKPPVESVADFKTTPQIHAGYAVTWYGLSAAGVYMTRMLITRGRG
jgi:cytochrome oxidase assembly protein ShyY1